MFFVAIILRRNLSTNIFSVHATSVDSLNPPQVGVQFDYSGHHCSWCTTPEGISIKLRSAIHQDFPRCRFYYLHFFTKLWPTPLSASKYVNYIRQHCYFFLKNLIPRRDSNPGLLFLRQMRCPVRHAARSITSIAVETFSCPFNPTDWVYICSLKFIKFHLLTFII
jgi:hypothetical protein